MKHRYDQGLLAFGYPVAIFIQVSPTVYKDAAAQEAVLAPLRTRVQAFNFPFQVRCIIVYVIATEYAHV